MHMEGDGLDGQPAETPMTLESLAEGMDSEEIEGDESDSEESDESEEVESDDSEAEESEDADQDDEQEEPTFTIKVDGKEVTLKQSEMIEQAQKGFDYTAKTMALAEERKALAPLKEQAERVYKEVAQAHTEAVSRLDAYAKFMESQVGQPPPITLAQQDAASYLAQKELYEARKGQLNQVYAELESQKQEQARQRQAWIQHKAQATEKALKDTLPGWNDARLDELSGYANEAGLTFSTADMAMLEPGFWQVLHKAKAYDALQAQKAKLKPVTQLPKVHKPSGNPQPPQLAKRQEAIKRHRAKPSLDSLADLL